MRDAIFAAAAELLQEHGYEGFSLRQVAERIGYTPTTIYRYFADRDALVFALTDEGFHEFGRRLAAAAAALNDPRGRLEAIGRAYVRFGLDHPVYYRLMFLQRPDFLLAPAPDSEEARLSSLSMLREVVARAVGRPWGPHNDVDALADALWAAVHGVVALALALPHFDEARVQAMTDRMMELIVRGLPG